MIVDILLFAAGLAGLTLGADWMVSGSTRLADSLGVPPLVSGLTVVAFGTSAPELVVSVDAAWTGRGGLAVGNVMGSTVANVGLIVGLCALFSPVAVHRRLLAREGPLVVVVLGLVLVLSLDTTLGRLDGLALLAAFGLYLAFLLRWALRGRLQRSSASARWPGGALVPPAPPGSPAPVAAEEGGSDAGRETPGPGRAADLVRVGVGLTALLIGARAVVEAATALALGLGVPEAVVGASLVAVGTSLPELASSAAAAVRGLGDVVVGNVVGSNVFNLAFVLGASAAAAPLDLGAGTVVRQVVPALAFSLLLLPLGHTGLRVGRLEGTMLLATYAGFLLWIAWPTL